ncbi:uncharacterized protein LOC130662481 [Hydractinia symbiolongicarpus]|uniref:uncharacterized protein LOC130662481 n=1 Tax=Hydractinia symbiolongicarpus TaxID=13093 RepID=UPI00254EE887|nr:uncharacterized protein LOC130662481 [Hydractinia symbiolongicarpus]
MPNTRGKDNWNNKATVRAIATSIYTTWRPSMWNLIKKDYSHVDSITNIDDDDDDDFLISAFPLISEVKHVNEDTSQPSPSTEPLISTEPSTSSLTYVSNTELKSLIVDLQEKVAAGKENVPPHTQEVLKKIGDSL